MPKSANNQSRQDYQTMENKITYELCHNCKSTEAFENKEVDVTEKDEDESEVRVVFNINEPYQWVMKPAMKHQMETMVTLSDDINELSIYAAGEVVFKSHVYSALGAALYEGKNMIIWVDYPIEVLKKFCEKRNTSRIYWDGGLKNRSYSCLEWDGELFGLSPAVQELKFLREDCLKEYGMSLKTTRFGFMCQDWDTDIRYVELNIKEINKQPTKAKLMKYLEMEEEEMKADDIIQEIRKRNEEKNRMIRE
jgi:hypothetical protein